MDKVFTVVMPLFAMIFAGYWIVRIGVIGKETVKGLVGVVFWLFLPCFIFIKTLGTEADVAALWANLEIVDCIATDHAPHTRVEKEGPSPPPGVRGLETTLPLLLTATAEGRLTLDRLVELTHEAPRRIYDLPAQPDTHVEVDPVARYTLSHATQHTKCGWTPFEGASVQGRVRRVVLRGRSCAGAAATALRARLSTAGRSDGLAEIGREASTPTCTAAAFRGRCSGGRVPADARSARGAADSVGPRPLSPESGKGCRTDSNSPPSSWSRSTAATISAPTSSLCWAYA